MPLLKLLFLYPAFLLQLNDVNITWTLPSVGIRVKDKSCRLTRTLTLSGKNKTAMILQFKIAVVKEPSVFEPSKFQFIGTDKSEQTVQTQIRLPEGAV